MKQFFLLRSTIFSILQKPKAERKKKKKKHKTVEENFGMCSKINNSRNMAWSSTTDIKTSLSNVFRYKPYISPCDSFAQSVIGRKFNVVPFFSACPWKPLTIHEYNESP
ncbi:hypothetical protein Lal_00017192 [Lupinus albus]|nr:hypothetical protein Lal_00017192 [Lupinus albus]